MAGLDMDWDFSSVVQMGRVYEGGERMVRDEITRGLTRSVIAIEADAKRLAPVLTHTLQRSITHEVTPSTGETTARVGTNLVYAKTAEEGFPARMGRRGKMGKGRKPHPYLKPALDKNRPAINREMDAVLVRISRRLAAGNG
jgi:hypothetical protein